MHMDIIFYFFFGHIASETIFLTNLQKRKKKKENWKDIKILNLPEIPKYI